MNSDRVGSARRVVAALLLVVAGLAAPGCKREPDAVQCPTGIYCPAGAGCALNQAVCIWDPCGNGKTEGDEVCDDGNKKNGDHCSADCKSEEICGNGIVDDAPEVGEVCDKAIDPACAFDCKSVYGCGNGWKDPGEDCDEGASGVPNTTVETKLCNANCSASRCGDGIKNATAGEQCDRKEDGVAGANGLSETCNVDCTTTVCGDGLRNALAGEACDDGTSNATSADCLPGTCKPNVCGDGFKNETLDSLGRPKEQCDDGAANAEDAACLPDCRLAVCGDTHVRAGLETCDTGLESKSVKTACPYGQPTCTLCSQCLDVPLTGPYCGDGTTQSAKEACDDGALNGSTGCDYNVKTCQRCNATCTGKTSQVGPYCGDGTKNGPEVCDDGNTSTEPACPYGQATCTLCRADCLAELSLTGKYCGDYAVQSGSGEACDNAKSFACGTCGAAGTAEACTIVGPRAATGSIEVMSSADLTGVTFTLSDGATELTFEFVSGGPAQGTNIAVAVGTPQTTAAAIAKAIKDNGPSIDAVATQERVDLTNANLGEAGNAPIVVAPDTTTALDVKGMQLGAGCAKGQACRGDADCLSKTCTGPSGGKTCQ